MADERLYTDEDADAAWAALVEPWGVVRTSGRWFDELTPSELIEVVLDTVAPAIAERARVRGADRG